jgi:hypothetical protein
MMVNPSARQICLGEQTGIGAKKGAKLVITQEMPATISGFS